jgi:putative hydrolase of the HAD superfamily
MPSQSPSGSLQLVIFDFDGLIIDTESAIIGAWKQAYALCRRPFPEKTFQEMIGRSVHPFDPLEDLLSNGNSPVSREEIKRQFDETNNTLIRNSPILPGVTGRLFEARARGILTAVASSSSHDWVDRHLKDRELFHHFDLIRCRDDVARAKPWPDLYLSVLESLGVPRNRAVAFEDSMNGLTAAHQAGITCIAIPNIITQGHDFSAADRVVASLEEIDLDEIERLLGLSGQG